MSDTSSKIKSRIRRITCTAAFTLLFLLLFVNLFILLSGRFYLYKGVASTYLKGRTGPSIYDLNTFYNAEINRSEKPEQWKTTSTGIRLTEEEKKFMNGLETSSFLIIRNDTILSETYFGEHAQKTVSNSFSAAKTVVSLLVGIAIEEGKIKNLDQKAGDYLPEFREGEKSNITIRHLLMMASGLDWEESGSNPLSENAESYYGTDLYRLVTRQKEITSPGKHFNYQSGNSQLLAYIVEKATGKDLALYAEEKIWRKIGTENNAFWSLDKKGGDEKAFCCIYATTRDFAKLGKLLLNKGNWNGRQVIPEWYIREMEQNPEMTTDEGVDNYRYGLHIWTYYDQGNKISYCRGILGQYIMAVPGENIIIVRTGQKRDKNFMLEEGKATDPLYFRENKYKVGHPKDLFVYLSIAKRISKNK